MSANRHVVATGPRPGHARAVRALLALPLLLLGCWPEPDLTGAPALERPPLPLPSLLVPASDEAAGNELRAVFVDERDPARVELTFVWRDEDHPAFDLGYDLMRWFRWHRVADVETSAIRRDPATGAPLALVLPGTFAADQAWEARFPRHHSREVAWDALPRGPDGRPRVWVATWNHLFGLAPPPRAPGVSVEWREWRDLPLRRGSREECQALYEATWRAAMRR